MLSQTGKHVEEVHKISGIQHCEVVTIRSCIVVLVARVILGELKNTHLLPKFFLVSKLTHVIKLKMIDYKLSYHKQF